MAPALILRINRVVEKFKRENRSHASEFWCNASLLMLKKGPAAVTSAAGPCCTQTGATLFAAFVSLPAFVLLYILQVSAWHTNLCFPR
jgi:hypothetical protein